MIVRKPKRKFTKQGQNVARIAKTTTEEVQQADNMRTKRGQMPRGDLEDGDKLAAGHID